MTRMNTNEDNAVYIPTPANDGIVTTCHITPKGRLRKP